MSALRAPAIAPGHIPANSRGAGAGRSGNGSCPAPLGNQYFGGAPLYAGNRGQSFKPHREREREIFAIGNFVSAHVRRELSDLIEPEFLNAFCRTACWFSAINDWHYLRMAQLCLRSAERR
jgi:hypothetical protein